MIEVLIAYKLSDDFVATYVQHEKSLQIVLTSGILIALDTLRKQKKTCHLFIYIFLILTVPF